MYPQGVCRIRKPACAGLRMRRISRFWNRSPGVKSLAAGFADFIRASLIQVLLQDTNQFLDHDWLG